jgi:hypothetical protein
MWRQQNVCGYRDVHVARLGYYRGMGRRAASQERTGFRPDGTWVVKREGLKKAL